MKAEGFLADVQGIKDAEEQLLHVVDVIEGGLIQTLAGLLAVKFLQNHACARTCQYQSGSRLSWSHAMLHQMEHVMPQNHPTLQMQC